MLTNALLLINGTWETIYMVFVSGLIALLGGIPLGVLLLITRNNHIQSQPIVNRFVGMLVNVIRAIPFIILLIALIPLTRLIVGTSIGTTAAIVPLTIGAIPFVARIIESALLEVDQGLIAAGESLGATNWQMIKKILIPEAMPSIINGITLMLITLVGYSAMAGAVGGGGLGSVAINYGYQRFELDTIIITTAILIVMVYLIQFIGDRLARYFTH